MPHKYEYTGDGTHTFPTLGKQPEPGEQFESDEPLNSPFLKEIVQVTSGGTTPGVESPVVVQAAADQQQQTEVIQPVETSTQQTDIGATEDARQEDDVHTEGVDE